MRLIFMGTPEFAVSSLEVLYERGDEVLLVISQMDKPKGRGKKMMPTPVKQKALEWGFPVYQPEKIKSDEALEKLRSLKPDVIVVTAYGQILSKEVLEAAKYGCINVHASLLPEYRGAAPMQFALMEGRKKTGVTTMMMDEGLDTGDMIDKVEVEIGEGETLSTLSRKLAEAGKIALHRTLKKIELSGTEIERQKQDEEESSYASLLTKEMGIIPWEKSVEEIDCLIRAVEGWPSATTYYQGEKVKIFAVERTGKKNMGHRCGEIVEVKKDAIFVATGDEIVRIDEVQFPNKKRMKVGDYLLGNVIEKGVVLGRG
ncbi:MAG: methionyl-tRNA formyltransferase [Filifactor alocis]|nr:methionyl-tRNA formyltransferase [Filifactor alocis]